jgi:basic amino acid/polyamine antiporter, APA family
VTQFQKPRVAAPRISPSQLVLPRSTALLVGSLIGVGAFSPPSSLAGYGPISLVAMGSATFAAVALAPTSRATQVSRGTWSGAPS